MRPRQCGVLVGGGAPLNWGPTNPIGEWRGRTMLQSIAKTIAHGFRRRWGRRVVILTAIALGMLLAGHSARSSGVASQVVHLMHPHPARMIRDVNTGLAAVSASHTAFNQPLLIPPVLTGSSITLTAAEADVPILAGSPTRMWTFNGTFPAPTIRRPTGQTTQVTVNNNLLAT